MFVVLSLGNWLRPTRNLCPMPPLIAERNWTDHSLWCLVKVWLTKDWWSVKNHKLAKSGKVKNLQIRVLVVVLEKICKSWEILPHQWKMSKDSCTPKTLVVHSILHDLSHGLTECKGIMDDLAHAPTVLWQLVWSKIIKWSNGGKMEAHEWKKWWQKQYFVVSWESQVRVKMPWVTWNDHKMESGSRDLIDGQTKADFSLLLPFTHCFEPQKGWVTLSQLSS